MDPQGPKMELDYEDPMDDTLPESCQEEFVSAHYPTNHCTCEGHFTVEAVKASFKFWDCWYYFKVR